MMVFMFGADPGARAAVIDALRLAYSDLPDIHMELRWTNHGWLVLSVTPWSALPFRGSTIEDIEYVLRAGGLHVATRLRLAGAAAR